MIRVGDLRHLAMFQSPTVTTVSGDTTLDPRIEDFEAWVGIQPIGGTESTVADQVEASRISLVTMRYDSRVNSRMQLVARERTFEILSVLNVDERDIELQLTCRDLV